MISLVGGRQILRSGRWTDDFSSRPGGDVAAVSGLGIMVNFGHHKLNLKDSRCEFKLPHFVITMGVVPCD